MAYRYTLHDIDGNELGVAMTAQQVADKVTDATSYSVDHSLVINTYRAGPERDHIAANIQTDGEPDYGVHAMVLEGPDGEQAFGAAWITAELQPTDDDPDADTLADVLDEAAMADYTQQNQD